MRKITFIILSLILLSWSNNLLSQEFLAGKIKVKVKSEKLNLIKEAKLDYNLKGIVKTGIEDLDEIFNDYKATDFTPLFPTNSKFNRRHEEFGLNQWYIVELKAKEKLVTQNLKSELDKTNLFEITEYYYAKRINVMPKSSVHTNTVFNDPRFDEQWHYENTGQTSGTSGADISLTEAWSVETGGDDVVVAIIDGGIDYNHQDLTNAMWINVQEENGTAGVDDDGNGYVDDIYGYNFGDNTGSIAEHPHGTHVAGTVGAINNNNTGVSGIAGGSDTNGGARLMSCQTFGSYNDDGFDVAFVYAADNGAVIAQNSWGYTSPGNYEQSVLDAIDYFIANAGYDADGNPVGRMQGGLVVFAAGNDDQDAQWYPAYYEPVFAVASTNHNDQKSWYSNFGDWVDISAPGGETSYNTIEGVLSTLPGNSYGFYQGTSMACPHVSGVAALIVSNNTNLTPDGVKQTLLLGSDYIDDVNTSYAGKLGQGRLNAFNSLSVEVDSVLYPINDLSINYTSFDKVIIQWTAKNNFNSGKYVSGYDIRYSTSLIDGSNFNTAIRIVYTNSPLDSAEVELFEIENLEAATEYYFAIKPISILGNVSDISNVISVTTNNPPEINVSISEIVDTLHTGETSKHIFNITNTGESDLDFTITTNSQVFSTDQTEFEYNIRTYSNNIPEYNVENSLEDIVFKPDFTKKVYIGKSDDNILVMEATSGANHYDNALNNLGLSRTLVTNWNELETELVNGTDWELVIVNSYSSFPSTSVLDEINNYLVSGELLIFADWGMYNYSSHALLQNMEIEFVSSFTTPLNICAVETSHPIFNNPNQFDNLLWKENQANINGQIVNILPAATQLAAFDGYPNNGAIVLNSSKNCIYNGFQAINFSGDDDSDEKLDIIELIENQISFLLNGDASWLNTDISSGIIPSGSSQEIAVTLNASGKNAGTYNANLVIENNDPDTSNYIIPVTLEVNGAPEISIERDTVIFEEVFVNQEITDSIYIENIGTDTLKINNIIWDETVFECSLNDSIIAPGEKEQFVLTFISSSEGSFTDSIEIKSDSYVDSILYIEVFAEALLPPIITISTDTLAANLHTGDTLTKNLYISNLEGGSNLSFSISSENSSHDSTSVQYYSTTGETTYHNFNNVSENSDSISLIITLNGDYTSSGEYASLSIEGTDLGRINEVGFPDGTDFIKTYSFKGTDIQNWLSDNQINVSIINCTEVNPGYGEQLNQVQLIIKGSEWFSTSINDGNIIPGDSAEVKITFNAARLDGGEYSSNLTVNSNDPVNPIIKISVELNVIAASDISIEEDTIVFDTTFVTTEQNKSVIIQNNGVLPLDISLSSNSGAYTLSDNNFSIAEGKNDTLTITFTPDSENDFSAKITLLTNDPDTPKDSIILFGVGLTPPDISINPDSLYATMDSGDSTELTLNIANVGANKLEYSIYKEYYTDTKNQESKIGFYADETRNSGIKLNLENLKSKDSELINLNNIDTVEFNQYCTGLKIIGDQLVSINYVDETLIFYDLNTYEVENSFPLHTEPYGITYDGQYIWIGNSAGNFYAYSIDGTQHGSFSAPTSELNSIEFNGINFMATALFDTDKNVYEIDYSGNIVNIFTNELDYHITGLSKISGSANKYWGIYYIELDSYAVQLTLDNSYVQILDSIALPGAAYYNTENYSNVLYTAPFGDNKLYLTSINSGGNGDWLNYSPESGTVLSGNNTDVTVDINASGMYDGTYYGNLYIESNDPENEQSRVPVTLTVIGYPELEISTDTLLFNTIYVGETQTNYFTCTNTGTKQVSISPIIFTSNNFEIGTTFPELILPGESETIIINFTPQEAGNFEEILNIQSDATINSSLSLRLIGNAIEPPIISISTDTLYVSANLGEDCSSSFTIENQGLGTLEYNISGDSDSSSTYFWESSLESENVDYNWTDIKSIGEVLYLTDDSYETKTLPFNFTFYGDIKNTIYISSNGFVSFNSYYVTSYSYQDLPSTYDPNDLIAAKWCDLFPDGDDIYYYSDESEAIIQYENLNGNTFQIIVKSDNTIKFQYLSVNGYYSSTGIENSYGTDGLSISYNQDYLTNEMAILIYQNFEIENINPTSGNLDYNENETIHLDFNTSNLQEGTFYKNILINSNDPQKDQMVVPVKLVVSRVNNAPYLANSIPTQNLIKENTYYINLNDYFADPDGDNLNYSLSSSVENIVTLNLLQDTLLSISAINYGSTDISIIANDGYLNANTEFTTNVKNETAIEDIKNSLFTIYPNPSNGIINIKIDRQTSNDYKLEILDLSGKVLLERIVYDNEPINIKSLPKGLKIVKVQVDKKIYIDKLLIN